MQRSSIALLVHEALYDLLAFLRNRQSTFFTLGLPVIFLVLFASVFGAGKVLVKGALMSVAVYYVPNLMSLAIISAAFVNLVISVAMAREDGIFKRRRATPVPAAVIIGGRSLVAVFTSLATTAVVLAIGWLAYGAALPARAAPALIVDVVTGTLAFCALGFAVASVARDVDSVQPLTQAIVLPLYFISGVFIASSLIPNWLTRIAGFFPVRHLAQALLAAYNPSTPGSGFAWQDLGIVTLWGVAGLIIALRRFRWLPSGS